MRRIAKRTVILGLAVSALALLVTILAQADFLMEDVARAKAQGLTSIRVQRTSHFDASRLELSQAPASRSIVVLRPARINVARTTSWFGVQTWHTFAIEQSLSEPHVSLSDVVCGSTPPPVDVRPTEIAIPFDGGTADVNGIAVTVVPGWEARPAPDRRYLAFLVRCGDRSARVLAGPWDWYDLTPDGRIESDPMIRRDPLDEVGALGTLEGLRQRLAR